jgi:hypothetical protein
VNNFLDVVFPPLLLLVFGGAVTVGLMYLMAGRARLWIARANRIDKTRKALQDARDGLAAAISDPGLGDANRNQVMTAYDAVTTALTKEKDNT